MPKPCWKFGFFFMYLAGLLPLSFWNSINSALSPAPWCWLMLSKQLSVSTSREIFRENRTLAREVTVTCKLGDLSLSLRLLAVFYYLSWWDWRNWKGVGVFSWVLRQWRWIEWGVMKHFIICGFSPSVVWQHSNIALSCSSSHNKSVDWGSLSGAVCPAPC